MVNQDDAKETSSDVPGMFYRRALKRVSQEQLGEMIGKSAKTINFYENGKASPTVKTLKKIAVALTCTTQDLLTDPSSESEVSEVRADG